MGEKELKSPYYCVQCSSGTYSQKYAFPKSYSFLFGIFVKFYIRRYEALLQLQHRVALDTKLQEFNLNFQNRLITQGCPLQKYFNKSISRLLFFWSRTNLLNIFL